jgi:hypothetical protein
MPFLLSVDDVRQILPQEDRLSVAYLGIGAQTHIPARPDLWISVQIM